MDMFVNAPARNRSDGANARLYRTGDALTRKKISIALDLLQDLDFGFPTNHCINFVKVFQIFIGFDDVNSESF